MPANLGCVAWTPQNGFCALCHFLCAWLQFVVAFPLAPLIGVVYLAIEVKVDSFKLLHNSARPVPRGAQDIGEAAPTL